MPVENALSRRGFLALSGRAGSLTLGGLWGAQAACAAAGQAGASAIRACIVVFYYGGPSHLDTWDLKPHAPREVRGEFQPISTSAPGVQISEHLPRMARWMHKAALVRSVHHQNRLHDSASTEVLTGRPSPNGDREEFAPIPQYFPCFGSVLSYLRPGRGAEVTHAALPFVFHNVVDVPCQGGGFLGTAYDPLRIEVDPAAQVYRSDASASPQRWAELRLRERRELQGRLAATGAQRAASQQTAALEMFYERAVQLLGSEKLQQALDLSSEPEAVRERYGYGAAPVSVGEGGGGGNGAEMGYARQMRGQNLLVARRLVEAGVPFVNVYDFRQQGQNWDAHFHNFNQHKTHLLPQADQALSALLQDLDERGLLETTLVVAMGEFGRTPQINAQGGRDHWPDCYSLLLAGGGVQGGAVYGASDAVGAYPATDPITPADIAATIYWRFGVDPGTIVRDQLNRPVRIADGQPLTRLF